MSEVKHDMPRVQMALSDAGLTMFRQNVGMAWVGQVVKRVGRTLLLRDPAPLRAGLCKGSSDLIGWKPHVIRQEDVGKVVAIFTACECKATANKYAKPTKEQAKFIAAVQRGGGIAGVARTPEDAAVLASSWQGGAYGH